MDKASLPTCLAPIRTYLFFNVHSFFKNFSISKAVQGSLLLKNKDSSSSISILEIKEEEEPTSFSSSIISSNKTNSSFSPINSSFSLSDFFVPSSVNTNTSEDEDITSVKFGIGVSLGEGEDLFFLSHSLNPK